MLGAGAVIGAIDECLGIANHVVQPFEHLTIRIEYFPFVIVAFSQRCSVCVKAIGLYGRSIGNATSGKGINGSALDVGYLLHAPYRIHTEGNLQTLQNLHSAISKAPDIHPEPLHRIRL